MPSDRSERERRTIAFLTSGETEEPLRAALAAVGRELGSSRLISLHHRPGAGVTGVFSIGSAATNPAAILGGGAAGVSPVPTAACITSCAVPHVPDHGILHREELGSLTIWLHPRDPLLPGLPSALDEERVTALAFGADHVGIRTELTPRSYRPLRRAVVRARNGDELRYLKILRAGRAAPLIRRHELLHGAGVPVPLPAAGFGLDVVALHAAPGEPLTGLLRRDGAPGVDPHALVRTLVSLPPAVLTLSARAPWSARVRDYAEGAVAVLPAEAARIRDLARRIDDVVRSTAAGPRVPTHGDFYEGNLLITGGVVSGLLDLDALGPGHLVDDLACCVAHLAVLPGLHADYVHVPGTLTRFLRVFDEYVDPVALRSRAAAVALTLVAGSRRRPDGRTERQARSRLAVAERLLGTALGNRGGGRSR